MSRLSCLALAAALLCGPAFAGDDPPKPAPVAPARVILKLPKEVKGDVGAWIVLRPETNGKVVKWRVGRGLSQLPPELLADKSVAVFQATKPGTYRVEAWTALGDEPSDLVCVTVVIEGDAPAPTPPGPGPAPDALSAELKALFAADQTSDKKLHLAALTQLYRQAATTAEDGSLETVGDLLRVIRSAGATLLPADALPALRRRLAEYLSGALELDASAKLTLERRSAASNLFKRLSATLEGIAK